MAEACSRAGRSLLDSGGGAKSPSNGVSELGRGHARIASGLPMVSYYASSDVKASTKTDLRRIARLFRPYRRRLSVVLGLIVVSAGISMISPFLLRAVLDDALPHGDRLELTWLVLGMIGVAIVTGVLGVG